MEVEGFKHRQLAPTVGLEPTTTRLRAIGEDDSEVEGRGSRMRRQSGIDDVDARGKATTRRPAGRQGARRQRSPGGRGGRCGGGGWGGGRREEEPRRPGQVGGS
jgi:hypothetical protein